MFAARHFSMMLNPASLSVPFTDAITYLAAGERLNAGHDLYRLVDGDRQVLVLPWVSNAALLSPPPIAVIWRPIAALPFGYVAWLAACWTALLGTVFVLARRTGWAGVLIAAGLAPAIGEQLAAGNLASFFPGMLVLAWRYRGTSSAGLIIGAMASLKLAPIAIGGWLMGTRNWPGVAAAAATVVLATIVSILGAGIGSLAEYLSVAGTAAPSTTSISALTGIPVLSPALLLAGSLIAVLIGRWPAVSFAVGVIAAVL
ncbi:MAG TPA: glycosyltransferase 87 family protein, partial [Candidatus Limnocylindrales bacterium]|nr:glycosyltransferase 87 family protein [Candidatus Limnocylindrales bacterium]